MFQERMLPVRLDIAEKYGLDIAIMHSHFWHYRNMIRELPGYSPDPSMKELCNYFTWWSKDYICDLVNYLHKNDLI
jgi:hypothetical protein